jgi:hypothetical protein
MNRASAWKSTGWISTGRAVVLTSALPMDSRNKVYRMDIDLSCSRRRRLVSRPIPVKRSRKYCVRASSATYEIST